MDLIQFVMKSKVGPLYLVASKEGLQGIFFNKQDVRLVNKLNPSQLADKFVIDAVRQLDEYFQNKRKEFDVELDFVGTPFQKKVWAVLKKIPFGQTVSYKEIAKKINNPKAVRAVGTANGRNPFSIIVPCHRVIAADGSIGGYGGGIDVKKKLLQLEKN